MEVKYEIIDRKLLSAGFLLDRFCFSTRTTANWYPCCPFRRGPLTRGCSNALRIHLRSPSLSGHLAQTPGAHQRSPFRPPNISSILLQSPFDVEDVNSQSIQPCPRL